MSRQETTPDTAAEHPEVSRTRRLAALVNDLQLEVVEGGPHAIRGPTSTGSTRPLLDFLRR
ncbi:MAG TPA: hypothetical protein VMF65_25850 [Acidimicrobiales bacterium]|nr:hypothetical protein [Acidimicrobiales bacterium]